ncbi:probable 18S rRNA (guanine-N(7))-methyltransferase [Panonychus citri]|uniref:probable 18S rRNA (guanine-N(7))-methyltransferase n=1 Tax=Panonychus citri TaxID=50023 RepID=UPI0023080B6E|nr:probable 18S rRNA (guanine-N(7))-methyltransferase [Panonychus citri]
MSRPEYQAPPEFYYNDVEAKKYTRNSRIIEVQCQLSERALEILALPEGETAHLLDLGCGSALSSSAIEEAGHSWVGVDISPAMLDVASTRDLKSGDLVLGDLGQGLPFRPGTFDGAISISALQWLCNADKKCHNPVHRLKRLFESLYSCLARGSRAVFQFYPEDDKQVDLITTQAMKAGFTGGLLVDYPNSTKAKKVYLVLFTGGDNPVMPKPLMNEHEMSSNNGPSEVSNINRRMKQKPVRGKPPKKSREWILAKKERRRRQGKDVREDTKYTGRKRSGRF